MFLGSCTLAKFAGENINDSARWQAACVLSLATLGDKKERNDPISVSSPQGGQGNCTHVSLSLVLSH